MPKLVNFQNIKINEDDCHIDIFSKNHMDCSVSNNLDLEDIISDNNLQIKKNSLIPDEHREKITNFVNDLLKYDFSIKEQNNDDIFKNIFNIIFGSEKKTYKKIWTNEDKFEKEFVRLRRIHGIHPKKSQLYYLYRVNLYKNLIQENLILEELLITKRMRSQSGVLVISVIMPPDVFSCSYDCYYCPNDPKYSRSYFRGEPTVQRGERNNFDPLKQFYDRAMSYFVNGHHIDKVEIIILGGTFSCYKPADAEQFINMLFYAANTIFDDRTNLRPSQSISNEITINENALCKIIGVTIETRPDKITKYELRRFRSYGVTRIQMGVQHTDDIILDKMNRQCSTDKVKKALKLAKDNGFKIDIHLMPDLPGASPEIDRIMFKEIIENPDYQADQWKIYPTNVLEFTKIKEWYDSGVYKPYAESHPREFIDLLIWVMLKIPPWIRINRIQRDFPGNYIEGGNKLTNLRQILDDKLKSNDTYKYCKDIRSMEVRFNIQNIHKARMVRIDYFGSDGKEIFLSHKSCSCRFCWIYAFFSMKKWLFTNLFGISTYFYGCGNEDTIYSFLRLRISSKDYENCFARSMYHKGKIRELHVYGDKQATYKQNKNKVNNENNEKNEKNVLKVQHHGFGNQLLKCAEKISVEHGCDGTCVIAGVGTRNYYRKFGYEIPYGEYHHGGFMTRGTNGSP
jgi:ELP3 family radical SAM enzyme/protein acetyltransferase